MPYLTFKNFDRDKIAQIAKPTIVRLAEVTGAPEEAFRIYDGGTLIASGDDVDSVLVEVNMYPRPADQMVAMAQVLHDAVNQVEPREVHVICSNISGFEYHYRDGKQYR